MFLGELWLKVVREDGIHLVATVFMSDCTTISKTNLFYVRCAGSPHMRS